MRRTISIKTGNNMKKIKTVIKKTYTTMVETYTKKKLIEYESKTDKRKQSSKF